MNKTVFNELALLVKDLRTANSERVKDFVEDKLLKGIEALKADAESSSCLNKDNTEASKFTSSNAPVPVYFDLWTECNIADVALKNLKPAKKNAKRNVLEHVYSPDLVRSDSECETVIRSYDRQNKVVYENRKLAGMCPNYAEKLRKALSEVMKAIADGKAGLTSKFDDGMPEYAKIEEQRYSDDEIAKVQTPVVNPNRPLDPIDDDERKIAKSLAKLRNEKKESGKSQKKAGKRSLKKKRILPDDLKLAAPEAE